MFGRGMMESNGDNQIGQEFRIGSYKNLNNLAQSTTRGATDTQKAAAELARVATNLRDLVERFKS